MEVDGLLPGHWLLHHLAPLQQGLQRLLQGLLPHTDELGRGGQAACGRGRKVWAVVQVVGQLEEQPRLQPLGVVPSMPIDRASASALEKSTPSSRSTSR